MCGTMPSDNQSTPAGAGQPLPTPVPQDKTLSPPTKEADGASTAPAVAPCCCRDITLKLEKVTVERLTDAGGPPGISGLFGFLTADHVFVFATDCQGKLLKYPDDSHGIKLDAGESASPHAVLATIKPDSTCYVDCVVKVVIRKGSDLNAIIDAITAITNDITKVAAKLASDTQTLQSLLARAGAQAAAIAAAASAVASDRATLADLNSTLGELLKLLAGTADTLMEELSFQFKGKLLCDASMVSVIQSSGDWNPGAGDNNKANLDVTISHLGGVWKLSFVAFKDCTRP
jgi:hypothetical protein